MNLEGYLSVAGSFGCVEVVNHCRTLAYVRNGRSGPVSAVTDCDDCCCPAFDPGASTPDDPENLAPWFDPLNPESAEFYGLYGDLTVAATAVETPGGAEQFRRRLTFTGLVLSSCDAGREYGRQWLTRTLESSCLTCRDLSGTVFTRCGAGPEETPEYPTPRPDGTIGIDCCDRIEPPNLGPADTPPAPPDSGARHLPRLRYVPGSLQQIDEGADGWPRCYGYRVTFSFDVLTAAGFLDPIRGCDIGDLETTVEPCCDCRSLKFTADPDDVDLCGNCGRPCECATSDCGELCYCGTQARRSSGCTTPTRYGVPSSEACRWSMPLVSHRVTCVTPPVPFDPAALIVTFTGGRETTDALVTIWDAPPGLPDPATCRGYEIFEGRPKLAQFGVTVPPGTQVIVDGRTQRATQWCNGAIGPAGDLVAPVDGAGGLTVPSQCCGRRLWVAVDVDCYRPPGEGFRVTVDVAGQVPL